MQPLHVTIVEDEPSHALLMDYQLRKLAVETSFYENGKAFLTCSKWIHTDLLIVSDQLHDIPISTFIEKLEMETVMKKTTVMIMSTGRQTPLLSNVLDIFYFYKPFSIQEFREKILSFVPTSLVTK